MSEYGIVERELRWGNVRNGVMGRERKGKVGGRRSCELFVYGEGLK